MRKVAVAAIALLIAMVHTGSPRANERPKKAHCPVCAVHGETEAEKVKAEAEFDGVMYYFCSDRCGEEFETDPLAYVPPELPRPAPSFVVESLDGNDVSSEFDGRVTLVDFWATWCKPCEKIMPEVQRLHDEHANDGLHVMGISIDDKSDRISRVKRFLEKHSISYPVYIDAGKSPAWYAYRVKAVPAMFLIDRGGRVVAEWRGSVDHEELTQRVAKLLDDAPRNPTPD